VAAHATSQALPLAGLMTTRTSRARRHTGGSNTSAASRESATVPGPHLSVAERVACGRAARAEVPRSSHATFEPSRTRDDPIRLLERQAKTRVPEVPIRYGRMQVAPLITYPGAVMIMAHDHHGRGGSLMLYCRNSASFSTQRVLDERRPPVRPGVCEREPVAPISRPRSQPKWTVDRMSAHDQLGGFQR
jgi:hypothetical protein